MELRQEILDEYHISHIHFQSFSSVEDQKVPNNIYCCDASTKSSFSRHDILNKIETIILNILKSLEKGNTPSLEYLNLYKWDNIRFRENHGLSVISEPKMTQISFGTSKSVTKFNLTYQLDVSAKKAKHRIKSHFLHMVCCGLSLSPPFNTLTIYFWPSWFSPP